MGMSSGGRARVHPGSKGAQLGIGDGLQVLQGGRREGSVQGGQRLSLAARWQERNGSQRCVHLQNAVHGSHGGGQGWRRRGDDS